MPLLDSAIISAVRTAVPDGESILPAWCASTISIESKYLAAWAANELASIEPIEKFGTTKTPAAEFAETFLASSASFAADQPLVPTTILMPFSTANSTTCSLTSRRVTSKITSAPSASLS